MKKLCEIGWFGKFCDNDPGSPHILHDREVVVHSFEERRELVLHDREVVVHSFEERRELVKETIKRFIDEYLYEYTSQDALHECIDRFLKNEGL